MHHNITATDIPVPVSPEVIEIILFIAKLEIRGSERENNYLYHCFISLLYIIIGECMMYFVACENYYKCHQITFSISCISKLRMNNGNHLHGKY